jgi:2-polyprenyl-3-methyl-5-hydroxy-6-metoxy-1,4-benzoquinol methylase
MNTVDQGSEGLFSPFLRRQRLNAALPYLRGRVLDFGCGTGKLSRFLAPRNYLGIDSDRHVIETAHLENPGYLFQTEFPSPQEKFDTVVMLAVIEHVSDPAALLCRLAGCLVPSAESTLLLTTPAPFGGGIHALGAALGVFSRHAAEEHHALLGRSSLHIVAQGSGLLPLVYRRFLFGLNQLMVFRLDDGDGSTRR